MGFFRTTDLNTHAGSIHIPIACETKGYFFHNRSFTSPRSVEARKEGDEKVADDQQLLLTGLVGWKSVEAMQEWYTDFAEGCEIYERLGYKIDALRMTCHNIANVESRVFDVNEDPFHERSRRGRRFPRLLPIGAQEHRVKNV